MSVSISPGVVDASTPAWALPPSDAARSLGVDPASGLTSEEARQRLADGGPNRLSEAPKRPAWRLFVDQFRNLLIVVLIGAAVLAGLVGDWKDTIVISVVLLLNACLGFFQEFRAERSLDALKQMLVARARVRRDARTTEVPADELVPGDVVLIEAGDRVPADGRLLVTAAAEIDESTLTGESTPASKRVEPVGVGAALAERSNSAFMNTVVTRGRAELVVTATGMRTEIGKLAGMLAEAEAGPTPLQVQLAGLGRRLAAVAAVAMALFVALELARGESFADTLLAAVALAVAAIPEGLPAVVTVTLAVGVNQMAKRGAIVKRLASVETLGSTSVICSDKTGTLTLNQMTARALVWRGRQYHVTGEGYHPEGTIAADGEHGDGDGDGVAGDLRAVLVPLALCNDASVHDGQLVGDPTEGALVTLAEKGGVDVTAERARSPRVAEVPFDPTLKLMATFHRATSSEGLDVVRVHVKGATDVLLTRCATVVGTTGPEPLDQDAFARIDAEMGAMAAQGLRVLAVAAGEVPAATFDPGGDLLGELEGLTLVALVGLLDPPRPEARDAIAVCRRAGVSVKMITGDHAATAQAIAADLGIRGGAITGAELDGLDDEELTRRIDDIGVVARVAPEHKVRMVRALKAKGEVVAMTGDGVNDAPALKNADIGVAMGITGTEVTKEAAAMVLTDDNFATIVRAVEAGRTIYANIVKFVRFQLSTNMGAILSMLGAPLAGLPVPFTAIQILWVNIIMDGPPAMALGVDPPGRGTMDEPPRDPSARILSGRRLLRLLGAGAVMAVGTLGVLRFGLGTGTEAHALSMAFTTFVLFQLFNAFNARSERATVFSRDTLRNGRLWAALAGVLVLQVLAVHVNPVQDLFGTADLTVADWVLVTAVASSILWVEELRKLVVRRRPVTA